MLMQSRLEKDKVAERILQAGSAFQAKIEVSALPYSPALEKRKKRCEEADSPSQGKILARIS